MRMRAASLALKMGGNRLSDAGLQHNQIPHEQVLAEFDLAIADWEK